MDEACHSEPTWLCLALRGDEEKPSAGSPSQQSGVAIFADSLRHENGRCSRLGNGRKDDLLVSFYRLEPALPSQPQVSERRIRRALPRAGFQEAFLSVQRRETLNSSPRDPPDPLREALLSSPIAVCDASGRHHSSLHFRDRQSEEQKDICKAAVAGFLRDRGGNMHITKDWMLDGSLSLQKVVLLNLVRLRELQIEYCPLLRKSEDLALSYEVILATGHLLKCQCYAYRAIHLERGGAEEVRRECRGGSSSEPSRLLLGGRSAIQTLPTPRQRAAVEALLTWMARSRSGVVDHHGDFNDGAEEASEALLDTNDTTQKPCREAQAGEPGTEAQKACGVQPSDAGSLKPGPVGWLQSEPKLRADTDPIKKRRSSAKLRSECRRIFGAIREDGSRARPPKLTGTVRGVWFQTVWRPRICRRLVEHERVGSLAAESWINLDSGPLF
ncbi:hypothetical protein AK812_SmicGene13794 [Symbiodinium microadriaticum]|uniref:Uncharacterized protein n=1 Tax=Symbiodinium microadriaticum TaxID=2951 RepID=A0A1Q9E752_SYMMI|nr:hypothetical protein AK812_SmicGene13794 [Symbiodinium microadriaticum]